MTHTKRSLKKIVYENPILKKETLNLKTFYNGNSNFSSEDLDRTPIHKNVGLNSFYNTEKNFFNKERYLHDMYNKDPIKTVSYAKMYKKQIQEREKNLNKSQKFSSYLGSNGVRSSVFTQNINYNDYTKEKLAEVNRNKNNSSNVYKSQNNKNLFTHMYDRKVGFYLK